MKRTNRSARILALLVFAVCLCGASLRAAAQQETVLYSFPGNQKTANGPMGGLIFDAAGNLYGTTVGGGSGFGNVFELSPASGGGWSEKTLYSFATSSNGDGNYPQVNLVFDGAGNLYGTTQRGGTGCNPPFGCGTVFELTAGANGAWTEKILYSFQENGKDGNFPQSGLILDAHGDLFGTTAYGGAYNLGTVYEVVPTASGTWKEKILHSFGNASDGKNPFAGLIFDASGNLYGTTSAGGSFQGGIAFELTPTTTGGWKEKILHSFGSGTDGAGLLAGLIFDSTGHLYGTTSAGGTHGVGTVFELSSNGNGGWTTKVLRNFRNNGTDGASPDAGLIVDAKGNLYGTTAGGGSTNDGVVFELSPTAQGTWSEKILHDFTGTDGSDPIASLVSDAAGNLYGTTFLGGANSGGEVFEITP